jgi:hypothetical protein
MSSRAVAFPIGPADPIQWWPVGISLLILAVSAVLLWKARRAYEPFQIDTEAILGPCPPLDEGLKKYSPPLTAFQVLQRNLTPAQLEEKYTEKKTHLHNLMLELTTAGILREAAEAKLRTFGFDPEHASIDCQANSFYPEYRENKIKEIQLSVKIGTIKKELKEWKVKQPKAAARADAEDFEDYMDRRKEQQQELVGSLIRKRGRPTNAEREARAALGIGISSGGTASKRRPSAGGVCVIAGDTNDLLDLSGPSV